LKKAISLILFILLVVGSPGFSFASSLEILQRINDGEQTLLEEPIEGERPLV